MTDCTGKHFTYATEIFDTVMRFNERILKQIKMDIHVKMLKFKTTKKY